VSPVRSAPSKAPQNKEGWLLQNHPEKTLDVAASARKQHLLDVNRHGVASSGSDDNGQLHSARAPQLG
jgi:hypothetical protein